MPQYLPFFPIQSFNSVKLIINLCPALTLSHICRRHYFKLSQLCSDSGHCMMEEEKLSATTSPVKETVRSGSRELWAKKLVSRDMQTDKYSSAGGIFHSSSSSEKVKLHL